MLHVVAAALPLPDPATAAGRMVYDLRTARGETGAQFGALIGLSKGKVSELERGVYAPSVAVALRIEELSEGRIDASDLNADVRAARNTAAEIGARTVDALQAHYAAAPLVCEICELRLDDPAISACAQADCMRRRREAA